MPEPRSVDAALATALLDISTWGGPRAAAAVVGPDGPLASFGDVDGRHDLASVTKLLAAVAAVIAVEEGTLDLDAPAGPPRATPRHLLAHAAGLGFDGGVVAEPGTRRTYSNAGFDAFADHLADRAGMPAADYVGAAVLEPLGLTATTLPDGSLAHGARSSVTDLSRFAVELLRPSLVDPTSLAAATTVQFPGLDGVLPGFGTQRPNDWGLGLELRDHKAPHWTGATNDPASFGHFGQAGTFLWVDRRIDTALVVLADRPFGPWTHDAWPALSDAVVAARSS